MELVGWLVIIKGSSLPFINNFVSLLVSKSTSNVSQIWKTVIMNKCVLFPVLKVYTISLT
jgi:hypothetical protein